MEAGIIFGFKVCGLRRCIAKQLCSVSGIAPVRGDELLSGLNKGFSRSSMAVPELGWMLRGCDGGLLFGVLGLC